MEDCELKVIGSEMSREGRGCKIVRHQEENAPQEGCWFEN